MLQPLIVPLYFVVASCLWFMFFRTYFWCFSLVFLVLLVVTKGSLVSTVDNEPALFVLYCLTHALRGSDTADENRKEKVERIARYQTD